MSRRCTAGWPPAARCSAAGWAGSGRWSSHLPGATETPYTWAKPDWLPWCLEEQRATRERVAVFDQTSFSLYDVSGPDALTALQWICAADVDVPVGGCVYTPFLNERGTYEADLTVTRTSADSFLLVSSSATTIRDLDWIERHLARVAT